MVFSVKYLTQRMHIGLFIAGLLLSLIGCAATIDVDNGETMEIVDVRFEVTGSPMATILIPDNDDEETLYFTDSALPFTHTSTEEEINYVFIRVIYEEVAPPATLTATIYRNGQVFQTNSWGPAASINEIIEGYLDQ
jgi:hypothetical protein